MKNPNITEKKNFKSSLLKIDINQQPGIALSKYSHRGKFKELQKEP